MVSVDDVELYVQDSGGTGLPIAYLNGAYTDQSHWSRVIRDLGPGFRHITYDERARGRSKRSSDYSFAACLRDLDAVLAARGVERVLLAGWSYGGLLSWSWADRHPHRVLGIVTVDAFPAGLTGEDGRRQIRKVFHSMRLVLPLAARLGLAARMSADEHAEVNIELNAVAAVSGAILERLTCPVRFVLASGDNLGSGSGQMDEGRAALVPILARNPNLSIAARVRSNHAQILRRDAKAVAAAIRELANPRGTAEPAAAT